MSLEHGGRKVWTSDQEHDLICFYEHNALLWNPADVDYCNEDKKETMLSNLVVIFDDEFDTIEIAMKFDDLKNTFLRYMDLKQDLMMGNCSSSFTSEFVHFDSMMFLCATFHCPDHKTIQPPGLELSGLKLVMWNVNGFKKRVEELENVMRFKEVNIALLSETHLAARHQSIALEGFTIYRTDRPDQGAKACGGTAIVIASHIQHEEIKLRRHLQLEVTGVLIRDMSPNIRLFSAYCAPNTELLMDDIDFLLDSALPTIICGDLNAKHKSWNSWENNKKGKSLFAHSRQKRFTVNGPVEMTFCQPSKLPDVLDIVIMKNLRHSLNLEPLPLLTSDHNAVLVTLEE